MDMLLAFRGVHGGAANAARTAGITAYFYNIAAVLVLIFLVIVFLAILGLCVELFRSWRTDPSEQGRRSGRILLIILVVLSGMSYVDYNYTNLLGGLCKEAVKGPKVRGTHVNRGNATNIGKYRVHDLPKVKWQFEFVADLQQLCAKLETAEPADIPALQQRLGNIKNDLRTAYGRDKSLPEETEALFRKLGEDIARKYPEEVVLEAQAAQRRAQAAAHARWERAEAYRPVFDEIEAGRKARGGAYTEEEVDRIVSIQRAVGWDEGFIQWDIDAIREAGHLPEGYQIPPKDVPPAAEAAPPAAETTPPAHLSPGTPLLGGAELTGDAIRKMDAAALEAHVNSLRPRARSETQPLNDAEIFAVIEQRRRFLAAGNKKAAEELERTFPLPPRESSAPDTAQPNINGDNSREKIVISPKETGVPEDGVIRISPGEVGAPETGNTPAVDPGAKIRVTPEDLSKAPEHGAGGRSSADRSMTVPMPQERSIFPWLENPESFPVSVRGVVDSEVSAMRNASRAGWNGIYSLLQKNQPWVMRELGGSPMQRDVIYRGGVPAIRGEDGTYALTLTRLLAGDGTPRFEPGSVVPSARELAQVELPKYPWLSGWGEPVWQVPKDSTAGPLVRGPLGRIGRVTDKGTVEWFSPVSASIPKGVRNGEIVQFNNGAVAQYVEPKTGPAYLQPTSGQAKWIQKPEGAFTVDGSDALILANKSTIVYNPQAPDDPLWDFFTYNMFLGKDGKSYARMPKDRAAAIQQAHGDLSRDAGKPYTMEVTSPSILRRLFSPDSEWSVSMSGDEELGTAISQVYEKIRGPQRPGSSEVQRFGPFGSSVDQPVRPIITHPQSIPANPWVRIFQEQVFPPGYEALRWIGAPGRNMTIRPADKILWSVLPEAWQKYRPSQIAKTPLDVRTSPFQAGVAAAVNTGATGLTLGALYAAADPMGRMYGHGQMAIQDPGKRKEHAEDALVAGADTVAAVFGLGPEAASTYVPTYAEQPVRQSTSSNTPHDTDPSSTKADMTTAASTPTVDPTAGNPNISAQTPSSWVVPGALLGGLVGGAFGGLTARGETEEERRRNRAKGFALGGIGGTILGGLGGYAADQYQV